MNEYIHTIVITIVLLISLASPVKAGYYYGICPQSINGEGCFDIGIYSVIGINGCKDWCGSQLFSFTPKCTGICNSSCPCYVVGNGAAYPNDYPCTAGTPDPSDPTGNTPCKNPAPTAPDCYCTTTPKYGHGADFQRNRFYFIIYGTTGVSFSGPYGTYKGCKNEQVLYENFNNDEDSLVDGIPGLDCFGVF